MPIELVDDHTLVLTCTLSPADILAGDVSPSGNLVLMKLYGWPTDNRVGCYTDDQRHVPAPVQATVDIISLRNADVGRFNRNWQYFAYAVPCQYAYTSPTNDTYGLAAISPILIRDGIMIRMKLNCKGVKQDVLDNVFLVAGPFNEPTRADFNKLVGNVAAWCPFGFALWGNGLTSESVAEVLNEPVHWPSATPLLEQGTTLQQIYMTNLNMLSVTPGYGMHPKSIPIAYEIACGQPNGLDEKVAQLRMPKMRRRAEERCVVFKDELIACAVGCYNPK